MQARGGLRLSRAAVRLCARSRGGLSAGRVAVRRSHSSSTHAPRARVAHWRSTHTCGGQIRRHAPARAGFHVLRSIVAAQEPGVVPDAAAESGDGDATLGADPAGVHGGQNSGAGASSFGAEERAWDGEEHDPTFDDPRTAMLEAALAVVEEYGWTEAALAQGAVAIGYPGVAHGMFRHGAADLVDAAMLRATQHMSRHLAQLDLAAMTPNERIMAGVRARVEYTAQWRSSWPQAMAVGALPQNAARTAEHLGIVVDEIWFYAGDRSTDMQWYSRRGLLLGVYVATELAMLTDRSPGLRDTWGFLERRINDVVEFGQAAGKTDSVVAAVATGVSSLVSGVASVAMPMLQELPQGNPAEAVRHVGHAVQDVVRRAQGLTDAAGSAQHSHPHPPSDPDNVGTGLGPFSTGPVTYFDGDSFSTTPPSDEEVGAALGSTAAPKAPDPDAGGRSKA